MTSPSSGSAAPGPARDFVGYGRFPPTLRWPGGAGVAVNVVLNYEEGAEYSMPDGDGQNDSWGEYSTVVPPPVRDLGTETHYEFGSRVGIWRLARIFDNAGLPVTLGACGRALERNPAVADWVALRGHDVLAHGYRWAEVSTMTEEEERADLAAGVQAVTRLTGRAPAGWYARSFPSERTRRHVVEHGGLLYDSDASNDELPYRVTVDGAPWLVVPYSKVYNDNRYLIAPTYAAPRHFCETLLAALDLMCEEAADGRGSRLLTVGLHARWSGQAARATAVRDFLQAAGSRDDVVFLHRETIARHWLEHGPPAPAPAPS